MDRPERKRNRLKEHDYSTPGYYFITICTHENRLVLWDSVGAACGRPSLSAWGSCVEEELLHLNGIYPSVLLDKYVIMPNHIHLILRILEPEDRRPQVAPTISRVVQQFKGTVSKRLGHHLWQKGFHDHVIRNKADYLRIWQYIDTNPAIWTEDRYYSR